MTLLKLTQVGQDILWLHPLFISESVTMVIASPKASHQIIIFSLDSAAQTAVQPTPPCSQTALIKRLAMDLVSPGSRSPPTWISVIVWVLCFHSGISCTLNHRCVWGQTTPVKVPDPNLAFAVTRGHEWDDDDDQSFFFFFLSPCCHTFN